MTGRPSILDDTDGTILRRLDELRKERADILACDCPLVINEHGAQVRAWHSACPVHKGDVAFCWLPIIERRGVILTGIRRALAEAGYRIGAGPDPVTGRCG